MHELACPSCNTPSKYDLEDYLLMCPTCSSTFLIDMETGQKQIYSDHYIVPNSADPGQIKNILVEWLKRLHHRPGQAEKEFFVVNISGYTIPYWVISLEAHTVWKGLVRKLRRSPLNNDPGAEFLMESGQFRRSYRWAISARNNLCETWGMMRLHEPKEDIKVEWDGFPLDSTFSRGQLKENANAKSAYDVREYFDFKYTNKLPILGIEVAEEEALRRAKTHVGLYHYELAKLNTDYLVDHRNELEIAGIQLIHLPFWHANFIYRPRTSLRHLYRPKERNVILEGFNNGVLKGELPIHHSDKIWINCLITGVAALLFLLLGAIWHPAFFIIALFGAVVSGASAFTASTRAQKRKESSAF